MASARARATRCAWPPESALGFADGQVGQAHAVEHLEGARRARAARPAPRERSPKATFSSAVMCGNSR